MFAIKNVQIFITVYGFFLDEQRLLLSSHQFKNTSKPKRGIIKTLVAANPNLNKYVLRRLKVPCFRRHHLEARPLNQTFSHKAKLFSFQLVIQETAKQQAIFASFTNDFAFSFLEMLKKLLPLQLKRECDLTFFTLNPKNYKLLTNLKLSQRETNIYLHQNTADSSANNFGNRQKKYCKNVTTRPWFFISKTLHIWILHTFLRIKESTGCPTQTFMYTVF